MHNYDLLSYYLDTILEELKIKEEEYSKIRSNIVCLTLLSSFRTFTYNSYYMILT